MQTVEQYDDIIFGGGKGGKSLALALAPSGRKVALIERSMIGGTCINVACIPTKSMVASSKLISEAKQASLDGFKIKVEEPNLESVIKRKREVVDSMVKTHWDLFTHTKDLDFFYGSGRFVGARIIEVTLNDGTVRQITAKRIFINSGSRPLIPKTPGLSETGYLTSTSVMELESLPTHLAILGGGYIALEFAQIFRRLGSRVTLIERSDKLLPREDEDIAQAIKEILQAEGIEISFNTGVESVSKKGQSTIIHAQINGEKQEIDCSHLLVATGRLPNTDELGLDLAGVKLDERGYIQVNEKLETSAPDIWAIGDCKGGPFFTHLSWDDYRILRDNLIFGENRVTTGRLIPYTLFIDPELGRVGLTEAEALSKGFKIAVAKLPAAKVPRANTAGATKGLLKAVVDIKTKQILGCSILANEAGEIIAAVQIAMLTKMPYTELRNVIFTHPTMCESLNLLFAALPH